MVLILDRCWRTALLTFHDRSNSHLQIFLTVPDSIITGEPNEFVREIHTRMPVILPEELHDAWLSGEAGKEVLVPFPADRMKAWPISPRVNSPKNNDPEVVTPMETESVALSENQPQLL